MPWIRDRGSDFDVYVCDTEDDEGGCACGGRTFGLERSKDGTVRLVCTDCEVGRPLAPMIACLSAEAQKRASKGVHHGR